MSTRISRAVWAAKISDPQAKLVLLKLADCADDKGVCWPFISTIADDTELSDRTVHRKLRMLETGGWLTKDRVKNGVTYTITTPTRGDTQSPKGVTHSQVGGDTVSGGDSLTGCHSVRSGVTHSQVGGDTVSVTYKEEPPRTTMEPPEREKSAPAREASPQTAQEPPADDWGDDMPTETARDFSKLQARINSLHPSWKKRPHFVRTEQDELLANSKAFFGLEDSDWDLLRCYMGAKIEESWGLKSWQPDSRSRFVQSINDILTHADKWANECRKRRAPTGLKPTILPTNQP